MAKTTKNPSVKPLGDRVVVRPLASEEVSASGIIIPDTVKKEKAQFGTVVAVGPGRYVDGALVPMTVQKGDEVLFDTYKSPVEIDGEEYFILEESTSILAVIPKN
jgi:chaperonin GroES